MDVLDLNEVPGMVPVPVGGAAGLPQEEDQVSENEEEEEVEEEEEEEEEEDISVRFFRYKLVRELELKFKHYPLVQADPKGYHESTWPFLGLACSARRIIV